MEITLKNIDCIIETPQFKDGKIHKMFRQSGVFFVESLKFIPNSSIFGHEVQFQDLEQFKKAWKN